MSRAYLDVDPRPKTVIPCCYCGSKDWSTRSLTDKGAYTKCNKCPKDRPLKLVPKRV